MELQIRLTMGRTCNTAFRDVVGVIKDTVAQSRAAFFSKPNAVAAILRATAHSPPTPPDLSSLLRLGHCSRADASPIIVHLMERLHRTKNCVVALKCLLVVHHIVRRGPFILQDQLSIFPSAGGRNYLKLSGFRDGATAATWALSRWVRWYARYLETLISASRALGYFIGTSSSSHQENQQLTVSTISNADLIKEIDSLAILVEEICRMPDSFLPQMGSDLLVKEITGFVINDYLSCVNEIVSRLVEAGERLGCLSLSELSEMMCALRKLRSCREMVSAICGMNKPSIEMMWTSVEGLLKDRDDLFRVHKPGSRRLSESDRVGPSESARSLGRVGIRGDSILFQSERFESARFSRGL